MVKVKGARHLEDVTSRTEKEGKSLSSRNASSVSLTFFLRDVYSTFVEYSRYSIGRAG